MMCSAVGTFSVSVISTTNTSVNIGFRGKSYSAVANSSVDKGINEYRESSHDGLITSNFNDDIDIVIGFLANYGLSKVSEKL